MVPAWSADGEWLYYLSTKNGLTDLYAQRVTDDGAVRDRIRLPSGNPERLTSDSINEFAPAVLPDGRQIAFHAFGRRDRDIYSLPLDGGPRAVVAAAALQEGLPEWSPDGRAIAFQEIRISGGAYVVRRGADGRWSAPRRLANGAFPRWSPDGRQFAYVDQLLGGSLFVMPADSGPSRLLFDGSRPRGLAGSGVPTGARHSRASWPSCP